MKKIYVNPKVCLGCGVCRVHCTTSHSESKDIVAAHKYEKIRCRPRARIEDRGGVAISVRCRHCDDPACVSSCMTGAIYKQDDGKVIHDPDRCVGCWMCVMSCPYGAIGRDLEQNVAVKCDLCPDRDTPACVESCPNHALVYCEEDEVAFDTGDE